MNNYNDINIYILCGGKSSRMGREKGMTLFRNKAMIEWVLESVADFEKVHLITQSQEYDHLKLENIKDIYPNLGPIGGIYSGLMHSRKAWNLFLSCDIPLISKETISFLIQNISDDYKCIYAECADRKHPLIAMYHQSINTQIEERLKKNQLKMMSLLEEIGALPIQIVDEDSCRNFNTPEDLINYNS